MNDNYVMEYYDARQGYPFEGLHFYTSMESNERMFHVKDTLVDENTPLDIFFLVLDKKIKNWTPEYKYVMSQTMLIIQRKMDAFILYNVLFSMSGQWNLILSSDDLEFGMPHTNDKYIIIPESNIKSAIENYDYETLAETMIHERIHIIQRYNGKYFMDKLSKRLGYIYYNTQRPPFVSEYYKRNKDKVIFINNPDAFQSGHYMFRDMYNNNMYYFVMYYDILHQKIKRMTFVYDIKYMIWKVSKYVPFAGRIRQYDHPNEVISIIITKMIMKRRNINLEMIKQRLISRLFN